MSDQELENLRDENERLRKVLEYYADANNYSLKRRENGISYHKGSVMTDLGTKAREVLKI